MRKLSRTASSPGLSCHQRTLGSQETIRIDQGDAEITLGTVDHDVKAVPEHRVEVVVANGVKSLY